MDLANGVRQLVSRVAETIRNCLVETYGKELIDAWPEASLRAEQIPLEGFATMFRRFP